jgi:hypothetical protein
LEVNAPKVTLMSNAERDNLKGAAAEAGLTLTYSIGMTADMDLVSMSTRHVRLSSCELNSRKSRVSAAKA